MLIQVAIHRKNLGSIISMLHIMSDSSAAVFSSSSSADTMVKMTTKVTMIAKVTDKDRANMAPELEMRMKCTHVHLISSFICKVNGRCVNRH